MKLRMIFPVIVTALVLFTASVCSSKMFNVDGFAVDVMWKVKNNKLTVWGDVEGGRTCKQITLHFYFANSKQGGSSRIETFTRGDHRPGGRSPFNGEEEIWTSKNKNYWFVDNVYLRCLR